MADYNDDMNNEQQSIADTIKPFDFNDFMDESLKSTPWWIISIAFHLLVFGILSSIRLEA